MNMKNLFVMILGIVIIISFNICMADQSDTYVWCDINENCLFNTSYSKYGLNMGDMTLVWENYNYVRIYSVYRYLGGMREPILATLKYNNAIDKYFYSGDESGYVDEYIYCGIWEIDEYKNIYGNNVKIGISDGCGGSNYDNRLYITLHQYEPKSLVEPEIDYKDYQIEVREIRRGRQLMPYWPEHYYYMAQIHAYEKGSSFDDKPVLGYLHLVGEDAENVWVGNVFQKVYKNIFQLKDDYQNYNYSYGDFDALGGKFYMDYKVDKLRFVFLPFEKEYKNLFFTVDFKNINEGIWDRSAFIIDSEDEKYLLPDDLDLDDPNLQDLIDVINNIVGQDEIYDPGEDSILSYVMDYIHNWYDDVENKFKDIIDIYYALRNSLSEEFSVSDWQGIKINLAGIGLSSKDVYIVDPGPINKIRVQLRVMLAGCMYFITALFVVRKGKDFFS